MDNHNPKTISRIRFVDNLRELMYLKNVTAVQICKDLGIKQNTFSDWYTGKSFPRIEQLDDLAGYLKVQPWALLIGW